jgi:peptidyl-tRNA hydrolase
MSHSRRHSASSLVHPGLAAKRDGGSGDWEICTMNNLTLLTRRMSIKDALTMYIVLRKDLIKVSRLKQTHLQKDMGWNTGSMVAQACHASTACIWLYRNDETVLEYMKEAQSGHMHKVVLEVLCPIETDFQQVKGQTQLLNLSSKLDALNLKYHLVS